MALSVVYAPQDATTPCCRVSLEIPLIVIFPRSVSIAEASRQHCGCTWSRWGCHRHLDAPEVTGILAERIPPEIQP